MQGQLFFEIDICNNFLSFTLFEVVMQIIRTSGSKEMRSYQCSSWNTQI